MKLSNLTIGLIAGGVFLAMLGLAFMAEPLYKSFCQITGFGGTTRIATRAPDTILDQEITMRFDANVADTALIFRPLQREQTVKIGQHGLAFYEVENPTDKPIRVIASYNVTPHFAGPYFYKLECFCFEERVIAPFESKKLPVVYFISPDVIEDHVASQLETITLSYTFFDSSTYKGPLSQEARGAANSASPG
ncbi:MAG: cytochrome C oxidase assembly protein [Hyphomonas sp. BRH_c22]|jgi:cytochrome c oxidase assembly protein subunit 11|uniref:cytochrome c oxidase assembly protein n=1 Tax=Hyphomonas sp. BRH_c22 TaxID=1629710 RepID=UPI0005F0F9E2|nr:cytochrome c oxidase assembly protein [Hyphomonas sp. BRH_c22]KJS36902.1 MAG: cytochrome C oxidase assembly protein [Hyphomonas sp. BRH_c22]